MSRGVGLALLAALAVVTGCSGDGLTAKPANERFSLSPGVAVIDTNCTGCNASGNHGAQAEQFRAILHGGGAANVVWSLSGGDATSGPGTITDSGLYTPPSYLTADRAQVAVTATLKGTELSATAVLTILPGFLQPLAPENVALGANDAVTVIGFLAEAGGNAAIRFSLASTATGSTGGMGTLSGAHCQHESSAYTRCSVTYTAPALIAATGSTWLVARTEKATTATQILLNTARIASNPAAHELEQSMPVLLGSSGGNNRDYDVAGGRILDCCSGTLGALVRDNVGHQYLLSNNHVLARNDQGAAGDAIIQPGLIDNGCMPNGAGEGTTLVGALAHWPPLKLGSTNVDAALARINVHAVDGTGAVLELGARSADGTLAAAPPGISSTGGRGLSPSLAMRVAKSGRTTGLTCGAVSAVALDIEVAYYTDCAETKPYLTKVFRNQIGASGNQFSDAGDSGALVVDAATAEPVGLLFAGGLDVAGVVEAVANPAHEVLDALGAAEGEGASFRFTGANDHPVSCLSYGNNTAAAALARTLSAAETARLQRAMLTARGWVNPAQGVLGVAAGKSVDQPGAAAVIVFVAESHHGALPDFVEDVRTVIVPTTPHAIAQATAPESPLLAGALPPLAGSVFAQALAAKQKIVAGLMRSQPAIFGVGVGQSYDNPAEAALVIYVDKHQVPAQLPASYNGVRVRYVFMDRLHVTRSYSQNAPAPQHCASRDEGLRD